MIVDFFGGRGGDLNQTLYIYFHLIDFNVTYINDINLQYCRYVFYFNITMILTVQHSFKHMGINIL